jgi:biotin synthase
MHADIRHDWTVDEALALLETPLLDLLHRAQAVHQAHNADDRIQLASLLSIKTGGCPEDCKYCPQSAHYDVELRREPLAEVERVLAAARAARDRGATRFCMGAAWREARRGPEFDAVLEMVRGVRALGLEACATLGMLTQDQADRLAEAGLTAYNHNIDTGPDYYGQIITTRDFADRLATLEKVRRAGVTLCTGGIIGMGESLRDRAHMLQVLAALTPHPESVPINALVAVPGTPLADRPEVDPLELVRMCAAARIMMPRAKVRLSAGRSRLSREAQILCFLAGANSIFFGERLLTTANNACDEDLALLEAIGAAPLPPEPHPARETAPRGADPRSAAE